MNHTRSASKIDAEERWLIMKCKKKTIIKDHKKSVSKKKEYHNES